LTAQTVFRVVKANVLVKGRLDLAEYFNRAYFKAFPASPAEVRVDLDVTGPELVMGRAVE
jgi:hypothetical protein